MQNFYGKVAPNKTGRFHLYLYKIGCKPIYYENLIYKHFAVTIKNACMCDKIKKII